MPLSGVSSLKVDLLCCCNNMDTHLTALLMKGKASVTTLKHSREQLTFTEALPYSYDCMFRLEPYTYTNTHNHLMLILCRICVHDFFHWLVSWSNGWPFCRPVFIITHLYYWQLERLATYTWKHKKHEHYGDLVKTVSVFLFKNDSCLCSEVPLKNYIGQWQISPW